MMKIMEILVRYVGRCQRADEDSRDTGLPVEQRHFHAGRREGYLSVMADLAGVEVSEMRRTVLGENAKSSRKRKSREF